MVTPERELSKQAWTWIKKRLGVSCEVTQDGNREGVFRICDLLPAAAVERGLYRSPNAI